MFIVKFLHFFFKITIRRGINVACGFRTGYHHVKVNVEDKNKSPMPVVIDWVVIYMCARGFENYGSAAISITALLRTSKYDDSCTFRLEKSFNLWLETLQNQRKGYSTILSHWPTSFSFCFSWYVFFGSFNTFQPAYIYEKLNLS